MEILTNPQSHDIVFSIASLLLICVTFIIHTSEENYYSKQRNIFGGIICVAFMINVMGLIHYIYLSIDPVEKMLGIEVNRYIVIIEKIFTYILPYVSTKYVMSIFQIEPAKYYRKVLLIAPMLFSILFFIIFINFFWIIKSVGI